MKNKIFSTLFKSVEVSKAFDKAWKNNTGYLDGAAKIVLEKPAKFTDDLGRPGILIPKKDGCVVIFNRYAADIDQSPIVSNGGRGHIFSGRLKAFALLIIERVVKEGSIPRSAASALIYSQLHMEYKDEAEEEIWKDVEEQVKVLEEMGWITESKGKGGEGGQAAPVEPTKPKTPSGDGRKTRKPRSQKQTEAKAEAKSEAKAEAKPEAKAEAKPEAKAEAKPEAKAEAKPEAKAEAKPKIEPKTKQEQASVKRTQAKKS